MSSKEQILSDIKKNTKILQNCQVRAQRYAQLLIAEAISGGQKQEQAIRTKFKNQKSKAIQDKKERLGQVKSEYEKTMAIERRLFDNRIKTIEEDIGDLISVRWSGLDFTDESWNNYKPIMNGGGKIPRLSRMGELTGKGENITINLPALLPIIGEGHVFLKASGEMKDKAIETMQCLMLRLLAGLPAAKLKFILIDPNGLGTNMAGYLNLPDDLIGGKPWTEENHIEKCLFDLTRHMEMVIQKYLTNRFDNMEEYNTKAGEVAEPYRIVAITDFPTRFTESSAQRLLSIALNGPKTGVHIIATIDKNHPIPHGFQLSELERTGRVIEFKKNRIVLPDKAFGGYQFELDNLPTPEQFNRIAIPIGEASKTAQKVIVPFDQIVPDLSKWWQDYSGKGVSAAIGRFGAQDHLFFEFGQSTAYHGLIAGRTGFGKSKLIHVLIMSLAMKYSYEEIEFYLIDFKNGIEFKHYADFKLPHAKVIAIESEREFGLSVLQGLDKELTRRGDLFKDKGGFSHIQKFRQKHTNERLPRILVIIDEYQELFSEDDSISDEVSMILDRLVRQGRAFGIHVLLASQDIAGNYGLSRSTVDQMAVRIALQCSDAGSRYILGDDNTAARFLTRPGEAIYNAASGAIEGNTLFQVFLLSDDLRKDLLKKFHEKIEKDHLPAPDPPIVFEGNAPAEFENNKEFKNFCES